MAGDHAQGDITETTPPNPVPFLVALAGFVVVVVLAYLFLWEDDEGRVVAPDRIEVVADDTILLSYSGPFEEDGATVTHVGYALGDDVIYVELVLEEGCADEGACAPPVERVTAELVLSEPIGKRDVRSGTGRALAECEAGRGASTCAVDR